MPLVSVKDVVKRFGDHEALRGASLDVAAGEVVALLGPSGSGKTTLLRLIAGLEVPDGGEVHLAGAPVARAGRMLVPPHRRGVGFVFQDLALWPHMTAFQHLEFALASSGVPRARRSEAVRETLRLVHIEPLGGRRPHELSGGEQQRLALARALVGRPRLLLLDEPLSSLDAELRDSVRASLAGVQRTLGLTAVCVTHDPEDAAALAGRVVHLREGRVVDAGAQTGTGWQS